MILNADVESWFTYHNPTAAQVEQLQEFYATAKELTRQFMAAVPPGRELELAVQALRQSLMWANEGMSCGQPTFHNCNCTCAAGGVSACSEDITCQ